MLSKMFELEITLVDELSGLVVTGEGQPNHKLLLLCQILQVAIKDASKIVESRALHWQVKYNVADVDVSALTDLLLQDGLRALLNMGIGGVAVDQT